MRSILSGTAIKMRVSLQPAFVLHTRAFRDTSLLLELFTLDYGRIAAIAKGVRGKSTRFKCVLQAFTPLLISWSGKGELKTLSDVENDGISIHLLGEALFDGFYLNELLLNLLQRFDPHVELFHSYRHALIDLYHSDQSQQQKILRIFEKQLLAQLGYGFSFAAITGENIQREQYYWFEMEKGFIQCNSKHSTRPKFLGSELLAIAQDDFSDPQVLAAAKRLMRLSIAKLLGHKELKSRELFL